MKGILKFAGFISLLIFILNISINGLVNMNTAVMVLILGIILQTVSDGFFSIILSAASLLFFMWSITDGSFTGYNSVTNGLMALGVMLMGI